MVIDPAVLAALRGRVRAGGVGAQQGPLRLGEAPAGLRGPKLVQGYGGPQPGPRVVGGGLSVVGRAPAVVRGTAAVKFCRKLWQASRPQGSNSRAVWMSWKRPMPPRVSSRSVKAMAIGLT